MTGDPEILFIIGNLELGGAERHLVQTLPGLARRGFRPMVYTLTRAGRLAPQLAAAGVPVITPAPVTALQEAVWLPRPLRRGLVMLTTIAALFALMLRRRPAVVHFFLPAAYLIGGLLSLLARLPVRIMSRRSLNDYQRKHPWLARLEHWLHPRMTALLGNSRAVLEQLRAEGAAPEQLGLLYNGLDPAPFALPAGAGAETRTALGLPPDALVLILVANLIPYKGHADLLAALGSVRDRLPEPWRLLCIGRDDGIGAGLRQEAERLGLAGNIQWLGERLDVPALLAAADLGLLCSHEEGFANAVLEGMAAGLPMIVTDVGGNAEAVIAGETGLVVPPRAPEALGAAILELGRDRARRQRFGAAGRQRIEQHFTLDRAVDAYAAFYRAVLARRASGPAPSLSRSE